MSKAQFEQMRQEEINRKNSWKDPNKQMKQNLFLLSAYFENILESIVTICKERKEGNK